MFAFYFDESDFSCECGEIPEGKIYIYRIYLGVAVYNLFNEMDDCNQHNESHGVMRA